MSLKNILHRYFKPFNINGSIGARRLSEASLAAVEIRKVLKITFPGVKFSVTSETYAGGDSVNIGWTNGPTEDEVKKYTKDFQAGHFDSQADIYEYSNTNNLPQVKWIFWNRRISEKLQKFSVVGSHIASED